ncbi:MAG: transketolase [Chloroflexi bacterium]|nr:transketolase [Chloroflexota bacterium]
MKLRRNPALDQRCINAIRFLSVDAVQKANSGHPGAPMGAAPMAYALWDRVIKHNPRDPRWPDRDRFVLSAGHASMLLYSLLHLTGYGVSIDDIKNFRQWGSITPGHPEHGLTPGIETTTGPLGQGFANGVGMALAERMLAAQYNRPGAEIVDHYTYGIVSDGDLQEGISSEAASLAGTLKLGKLIYLYDDNDVSIDGDTSLAFNEDVGARFRAYGWQVLGPIDGLNADAVEAALKEGQGDSSRPTLIIVRTTIGYGSPNKAGKASAHGEALGVAEVELARKQLGWSYGPFEVPEDVAAHMREAVDRGASAQAAWERRLDDYRRTDPAEAAQFERDLKGELPAGWQKVVDAVHGTFDKPLATRAASGRVLVAATQVIPALAGGSADLTESTQSHVKGRPVLSAANYAGRNIHFGVREHAMAGISNGMALHGGLIPYCATFLIFSDYMRPAVRLAALASYPVIFVYTHDSIGLGEDGPTHQPIAELVALRAMPNLVVIRPADAHETVEAWKVAISRRGGPTALVLTRQALPLLANDEKWRGASRGAYVAMDSERSPEVILIATGSELNVALAAGKQLQGEGIAARVVSMPSWELFEAQPLDYRESVLPSAVRKRVAIEAAGRLGWERYVGLDGLIIGMTRYGASSPGAVNMQKFGFTPENVADQARSLVRQGKD